MPDQPDTPSFKETEVGGRTLIVCTFNGYVGTARIMSKGIEEARSRAELQARNNAKQASATNDN
jgi:hypothetical protein